jgi:hypothetical protein
MSHAAPGGSSGGGGGGSGSGFGGGGGGGGGGGSGRALRGARAGDDQYEDHFPVPRPRVRSATFHRSWSHHNLLLKSERWVLPFQYNRVHFFDYDRDEVGIDEHMEAGGMMSTRSKGLVLSVMTALKGATSETWQRRRAYHESVSRWQRFLHHSLKVPPPRVRRTLLGGGGGSSSSSKPPPPPPVEVVFVRHCEANHNAMDNVGLNS